MESLILQPTSSTPTIRFDVDKFEFFISGECRPENVLIFFEPITKWLNEFKNFIIENKEVQNKWLEFNFNLEYFNSSSAKFIFDIFKFVKSLETYGISSQVNWHYDELDEDLLECGQEYQKILNLNFKYIALQD